MDEVKQQNRWVALDVLKGMGVLTMVLGHSLVYWFVYENDRYIFPTTRLESGESIFFQAVFIIAAIVITFLPLAAGAALYLSLYSKAYIDINGKIQKPLGTLQYLGKRSLIIFVLGFLMNVLAWGWEWLWFWNILQFYAASILIVGLVLVVSSSRVLSIFGLCSLASTFFLDTLQNLAPKNYLLAILIGDPASIHIWPLIPWFYVLVAGFLVGLSYQHLRSETRTRSWTMVGVLLICVSTPWLLAGVQSLSLNLSQEQHLDIISAPPSLFFLGAIGAFLISAAALTRYNDSLNAAQWRPLRKTGQAITAVYVVHMISAYWYFQLWVDDKESLWYLALGLALQVGIALIMAEVFSAVDGSLRNKVKRQPSLPH